MMGQQQMGMIGMGVPGDVYGLGNLVTSNAAPPRPVGLITPRTPSRASSAYLWKSQPESAARIKAPASHSRAASSDGSGGGDRSPRSSASFSLPPSAADSRISPLRAQTPPNDMVGAHPSSLLRVSMNRTPPQSPRMTSLPSPRELPLRAASTASLPEDMLPPLRRPTDTFSPRAPVGDTGAAPDRPL